jgi:hypothetical protein
MDLDFPFIAAAEHQLFAISPTPASQHNSADRGVTNSTTGPRHEAGADSPYRFRTVHHDNSHGAAGSRREFHNDRRAR